MTYDVDTVRRQFRALDTPTAHFDGPGGTQTPAAVAEAVADMLGSSVSNRGRITASERNADDTVAAARRAIADLLGADPSGVVFGRSMTQLTYDFARTLAKRWSSGDEVVVSRLDHDANVPRGCRRPRPPALRCAGLTSTRRRPSWLRPRWVPCCRSRPGWWR